MSFAVPSVRGSKSEANRVGHSAIPTVTSETASDVQMHVASSFNSRKDGGRAVKVGYFSSAVNKGGSKIFSSKVAKIISTGDTATFSYEPHRLLVP